MAEEMRLIEQLPGVKNVHWKNAHQNVESLIQSVYFTRAVAMGAYVQNTNLITFFHLNFV